jgi:hypothetical protein
MIDKTMCEVLWRNISDFYVNLWVEVEKHPQVILAMYFYKTTDNCSIFNADLSFSRNKFLFNCKIHK